MIMISAVNEFLLEYQDKRAVSLRDVSKMWDAVGIRVGWTVRYDTWGVKFK